MVFSPKHWLKYRQKNPWMQNRYMTTYSCSLQQRRLYVYCTVESIKYRMRNLYYVLLFWNARAGSLARSISYDLSELRVSVTESENEPDLK